MDAMQFELAAEYLLMAAMLAEIKSRMLLPRSNEADDDEEDPRASLVRRLQEYERFKKAAEDMATLPRVERDTWVGSAEPPVMERTKPLPEVNLQDLVIAFSEVLKRADLYESHQIKRESLSTRERMADVLQALQEQEFCSFDSLFKVEEGRLGVVVTFLAILELIKESLVDIVKSDEFAPIHIKARSESSGLWVITIWLKLSKARCWQPESLCPRSSWRSFLMNSIDRRLRISRRRLLKWLSDAMGVALNWLR